MALQGMRAGARLLFRAPLALVKPPLFARSYLHSAKEVRGMAEQRWRMWDCMTKSHLVEEQIMSNELASGNIPGSLEIHREIAEEGEVTWYSCGPTVYDAMHLGHARTYVSIDIIQRILSRFCDLDVVHALGMTDVDDKILARAQKNGEHPITLARRHETAFCEDLDTLGVQRPALICRVTEHIPAIFEMIGRIMENGYAYQSGDSVYFDTERYDQDCGYETFVSKGEGIVGDEQSNDLSIAESRGEKRSIRDFALWKGAPSQATSEGNFTVGWESPWGYGRPGWHIECSAMNQKVFGKGLHIHAGGRDLIFPHHANEIAQCRASLVVTSASGKGNSSGAKGSPSSVWPKCFVHIGHLHIEGRKMSKSLKNFITLREYLSEGGSSAEFRVFCLFHHYRKDVHFSSDTISLSKEFLQDVRALDVNAATLLVQQVQQDSRSLKTNSPSSFVAPRAADVKLIRECARMTREFKCALRNDFDTPKAMRELYEVVKMARRLPLEEDVSGHALSHVADRVKQLLSDIGTTHFDFEILSFSITADTSKNFFFLRSLNRPFLLFQGFSFPSHHRVDRLLLRHICPKSVLRSLMLQCDTEIVFGPMHSVKTMIVNNLLAMC